MRIICELKIFKILTSNYLLKSSGFFTVSQGIAAIVNFAILALYTKYLPPLEFGKIAMIWMFVLISSIVIDSGMNTAFSIKFYKIDNKENAKHIYSIFAYYLIILVVLYVIFRIFPSFFLKVINVNIPTSGVNILFLLLLSMLIGNFYTNILIVDKKPKEYFFIILIFNLVLIISSVIYLTVLKSGYFSYIYVYLISYIIISLIGLRFFLVSYKFSSIKIISIFSIRKLLKLGIPLVPNSLLLMLLTWADRYIINIYSGLAVVGIYTIGYRFSQIIDRFIVSSFGKALSPILFQQFATSIDEYKNTLSKLFKYYWIVILGITITYFVILKEVFSLLISVKYVEGYNIIPVVLLGVVLWGITNLLGVTLIMKEKTNKMFLFTFISVLLNIGLNFLLIPQYGMYGAAIATFISYFIQFVLIFKYTQKLLKIDYDYGYTFMTISISLFFLGGVIFVSYLDFSPLLSMSIKAFILSVFLFVSYKYMGIKKLILAVRDYQK